MLKLSLKLLVSVLALSLMIAGVSTNHARSLAENLARLCGYEVLDIYTKIFPDGESYVRINGDTTGSRVTIVVDCSPPRQNTCLIETLLALDALAENRAEAVALYIPYMPYARQDRVFLKGEALSSRAILKAIESMGASRIATVELHSERLKSYFAGELINIKPLPFIARAHSISSSSVIVAPDHGARSRAESVASSLGAELVVMSKKRDRVTGEVKVDLPQEVNLEGREAYIVDDMVSTGSTIAEASRILLERGASKVYVMVAHYLNLPGSSERLREAGVSRVIASNTIAPASSDLVTYIDISELVAREICRV